MKKAILLSSVCACVLALGAEDLGEIYVESSTIDDKFDTTMYDVSSTDVMDESEVESFHAENIANVLNTIPGVTVRENENDSNKIHIRGIAAEMYMGEKPGVAIVIDGVPVQERAGSVNIDPDNIESIKVIKGGASYLYGNDALAGAVIITTKRPKAKNQGFVSVEQGSYGYEKYIAAYNFSGEKFAARIQGSYKGSDGYWENSDYWTKSINGKFQYYIDDSSDITIGIDRTKRYENDTGSITYATYNPDTKVYTYNVTDNPKSFGEVGYATEYDINLDKYFVTYSKDFADNSNLMVQLYRYEDETTNKSGAYDSNRDGLRDDHLYDSYADTVQKGLKAEYRMGGETFASLLGLDLARNDMAYNRAYRVDYTDFRHTLHPAGEVVSNTSGTEDINAIYGEVKYSATKALILTANARYDEISYDYTDNLTQAYYEKNFYETSYRLGATYTYDTKTVFYGSVSTGFRVPQITQIFAGDIYGASWSGTYVNNPDLKTEKTTNYEIGLRYHSGLFYSELSVYQLDRKDVIGRSTGNYASANGDEELFYSNMSDVRSRGVELSLRTDNRQPYFFTFNYTYLDSTYTRYDNYYILLEGETTATRYDVTGNRVPRTSKHTIYAEANYRPVPALLLTAGLSYRSSQYADERNEIEVGGYSVLNLRAKYDTKVAGKYPVEFFFNANNVLDKQYYMMPRVTGDRNDDGLYDIRDMGLTVNPGRTFLVGLSAKF